MNRKQKFVAWVGLALMGLMAVFPPWNTFRIETGEDLGFAGYSFYDSPPEPAPNSYIMDEERGGWTSEDAARINWGRLLAQIIVVGALTAGIVVVLAHRPARD